ncbi:MAG TPA: GGDEF domain-containing protein [Geobacteraceae bacterium]|nr:GGDEF domain-containing protein [Geobacteraceae bacterium]
MFDVLSKPNVSELMKMPLFADVSPETIEQIVESFVIRRLKSREVLIAPDQPNHFLYLVLSGKLSVFLDSTHEEPVCSFGPGEPIGELSVIDKHTTSAHVIAEEDSRLLVLDETQVWSLVKESHAFAHNLLVNLSERLRRANELIIRKSKVEDSFYDFGMLDVLTGMHSRRWFDRIIGRALKRCIIDAKPFSVLLADIDNFREYNERHGRMCGDMALNKIARTIQEHLRVMELAVRYEGDRLLVLLPETELQQARKVAERLRHTIMYTDIPGPGGRVLPPLTLSMGIAQASADQSADELMHDVTVALMRAKDMGRNYVSD